MAVGLGVIPQFPASVAISSPVKLDIANGVFTFSLDPTIVGFGSGASAYSLLQRYNLTTLPVPTFRPLTANSALALDLTPNGSPTGAPIGTSAGLAWLDICDADLNAAVIPAFNSLHLGAHTDAMSIGVRTYSSGANVKPLALTLEDMEIFRAKFITGNSGAIGIGFGTTTPAYRLDVRANTSSQIHLTSSANDDGAYLFGQSGGAGGLYAMGGAAFNGTNFVARETASSIVQAGNLGIISGYVNTGLTPGNTFTPTEVWRVDGAGVFVAKASATPAGGTTGLGLKLGSATNLGLFFGSGAPTLSAAQGSLYIRTDGSSTSTRAYVNTNGTTGWAAITTAS